MKIEVRRTPENDGHIVKATFDEGFLQTHCEPLPYEMRQLITREQGLGIITDAILMAYGYQLKPNQDE